ncbi:MAG: YdcF family protein [Patescibacteria group bacterium]
MKKEIVAVLGGCPIKDNNRWRTTNFNEGDEAGVLGDRLRVEAAFVWYQKYKVKILAIGGRGQLKNIPGSPAVAAVIKKELVDLGVPANFIKEEKKSGRTYSQLQALKKIIERCQLTKVTVISNRYHLPRIKAMLRQDNGLKSMLNKKKINLQSAEQILIAADKKKWKKIIDHAYLSDKMKLRIALERQGVRQIKAGTYNLK